MRGGDESAREQFILLALLLFVNIKSFFFLPRQTYTTFCNCIVLLSINDDNKIADLFSYVKSTIQPTKMVDLALQNG